MSALMTIQVRLCGQEVQTASASEEQTSCMNLAGVIRSNCGGGFEQLTDGSKTFYQDAVNSVWQHKQVDWPGQGHVSD